MTDKKQLKRQYREFHDWLVGYLDGRDPARLMGGGNPGREYTLEASRIVPLLQSVQGAEQLAPEIYRIFAECMGEEVIGSKDQYDEIAVDIYCRWEDVFKR
jgi:hypothetical protein